MYRTRLIGVMKTMITRKSFQRLLTAAIILYGTTLNLFMVARLWIDDTYSVMGLYATAAHLLMLGALAIFPFGVWLCRPRRWVILLVPPMIVFLAHYGAQFTPMRERPMSAHPAVTVMSYNVLYRPNGEYQDALRVIKESGADIVGLQEVNPTAEAFLIAGLRDIYPYWAIDSSHRSQTGGIGLFSRYPIVESETIHGLFNNQRVVMDVDGTPLVVYNVHVAIPQNFAPNPLGFNATLRAGEVRELARDVASETERAVLLGDFNLPDQSNDYQVLAAALKDVYRDVGWGMGWTHPGPFIVSSTFYAIRWMRIDYIFIKPDGRLQALNARVLPDSGGSDHSPVVAMLALVLTEG